MVWCTVVCSTVYSVVSPCPLAYTLQCSVLLHRLQYSVSFCIYSAVQCSAVYCSVPCIHTAMQFPLHIHCQCSVPFAYTLQCPLPVVLKWLPLVSQCLYQWIHFFHDYENVMSPLILRNGGSATCMMMNSHFCGVAVPAGTDGSKKLQNSTCATQHKNEWEQVWEHAPLSWVPSWPTRWHHVLHSENVTHVWKHAGFGAKTYMCHFSQVWVRMSVSTHSPELSTIWTHQMAVCVALK